MKILRLAMLVGLVAVVSCGPTNNATTKEGHKRFEVAKGLDHSMQLHNFGMIGCAGKDNSVLKIQMGPKTLRTNFYVTGTAVEIRRSKRIVFEGLKLQAKKHGFAKVQVSSSDKLWEWKL